MQPRTWQDPCLFGLYAPGVHGDGLWGDRHKQRQVVLNDVYRFTGTNVSSLYLFEPWKAGYDPTVQAS